MKKIMTIASLFFLFLNSCDKENEAYHILFSRDDFPVSVGSYWVYECQDLHHDVEYSVKHQIEWTETISADMQIIHYTLYSPDNSVRDSAIGILTDSGFTYLGVKQTNYSILGDFHIAFPFAQNDQWVGVHPKDTLHVVYYADKLSNYDSVFYLYNYYRESLIVRANEIYLSKGVGIVTKNLRRENGNSQLDEKRSYTLTEFHIE